MKLQTDTHRMSFSQKGMALGNTSALLHVRHRVGGKHKRKHVNQWGIQIHFRRAKALVPHEKRGSSVCRQPRTTACRQSQLQTTSSGAALHQDFPQFLL